jgi:dihydropteroate synthase
MTLNCHGNLLDLRVPKVMGILNVTPDSFFDGGRYSSLNALVKQAESMVEAGATFIDIGGYSSKPGAAEVSESEELQRVLPLVKALQKSVPKALLSIDTFRSGVAQAVLDEGVAMVNDITAGADPQMMDTVAKYKVPYVMMHMRGNPQTMQSLTQYENLMHDLLYYFAEKIQVAKAAGITDYMVDPGFGFAKTTEQNFEILRHLNQFAKLEAPLLIGFSRKSMIYKTLQTSADNALNGTTFLHGFALDKGAKILRVHDVKEAVECVTLFQKLVASGS